MAEQKWHEKKDTRLRPSPILYRLETKTEDGKQWLLSAVVYGNGNVRRKYLQLPKHDAETIREILNSLYGEKWELVRDGDQ